MMLQARQGSFEDNKRLECKWRVDKEGSEFVGTNDKILEESEGED